jgi:hypothetical protein
MSAVTIESPDMKEDFSLVLGGPLFQIFRRAYLSGSALFDIAYEDYRQDRSEHRLTRQVALVEKNGHRLDTNEIRPPALAAVSC